MTQTEIQEKLEKHAKWPQGEEGGERADFSGQDLRGANLQGANLWEADLEGANLEGINPEEIGLSDLPSGKLIGWKKCCDGVIVKMRIPENAKRCRATTNKCRAEFVEVLEVIGAKVGVSQYDERVVYQTGETVHCDEWDDYRWVECSGGIHFFLTREEAEDYWL